MPAQPAQALVQLAASTPPLAEALAVRRNAAERQVMRVLLARLQGLRLLVGCSLEIHAKPEHDTRYAFCNILRCL